MTDTHISLSDVLSHYNVVGMAIAVAIGMAGKDLFFSLSDDIVMPFLNVITGDRFKFLRKKFQPDNFMSSFITFILVTFSILIILYTILRPMVEKQILDERKKKE
jgi:large-conductance mechanosensitive channel